MTTDKAAIEAKLEAKGSVYATVDAVRMLLEMVEARTTDMREDLDEAGAWIAGVEERLAALEKASEASGGVLGPRKTETAAPLRTSRQAEAPNEPGTTSAAPDPFCQKHSNPSGTRSERDACVGCAPDFAAMVSISREEWDALKAVEALAREVHATQPEATITHDAVERLDAARANAHRLQAPPAIPVEGVTRHPQWAFSAAANVVPCVTCKCAVVIDEAMCDVCRPAQAPAVERDEAWWEGAAAKCINEYKAKATERSVLEAVRAAAGVLRATFAAPPALDVWGR
jgi:hypothetical protein